MKNFRKLALSSILAALTTTAALAQMGGHTPPVPMTPTQFQQATVGENIQIAVRVTKIDRTTLYTELLRHESETVSKGTGMPVEVYFADGTPLVMGSASDVTKGAVLFVYGILTSPGHVDAKRVVVDTKFITVQ